MKKEWGILLAIFIIVAGIRIFFAFQADYFSDDYSYFTLRQIEHIKETFVPLYGDNLSYGGRTHVFLPLFHYILAFFTTLFNPIIVAKVLPNLFASSIVFVVYLLVKEITKNENISLFTSVFSAFIPIYFYKTLNTISLYSISVPLSVLLLYLFINIDKGANTKLFLITIIFLMLTHTSVILLVLSLIVYLVLVKIEDLKLKQSEIETTLFSAFVMLWMYLLVFKKAFLKHGFSFIWQNMPTKYLTTYFHQIPIWEAIYLIGIIPFVLGLFITYHYLFNRKNKKVYLLISFALTTTCLLWMKLIKLEFALIFLGVILVILFGIAYNHLNNYLKTTRFAYIEKPLFVLICILFIATSIVPSIMLAKTTIQEQTNPDLILALNKLKENSPIDARIASSISEGHAVTYFSERKNLADSNFLFLENANEVVSDLDVLFTTISKIKVNEILDKYHVDYMVFTPENAQEHKIKKLSVEGDKCFVSNKVNSVQIFRNKCRVIKSMMIN